MQRWVNSTLESKVFTLINFFFFSNNSEDQQDTIDQKSKLVEEAVQKAKEANNLFPDDINK